MDTDPRVRETDQAAASPAPTPVVIGPGAVVVLRRPRELRGAEAIVRRRVPGGWEVEVRSATGLPMHLTLPARALRLPR